MKKSLPHLIHDRAYCEPQSHAISGRARSSLPHRRPGYALVGRRCAGPDLTHACGSRDGAAMNKVGLRIGRRSPRNGPRRPSRHPTRGRARKIGKLLRLGGGDRRLLVHAALWLLATDLGLRTLGFARTRRLLAVGRTPCFPSDAPPAWGEIDAVAWAVAAAAAHHLYPMRCLARSLVLERLLARRGVPSELRIGMQRDEEGFRAHAWIECFGRPVAEGEGVRGRFASVALPGA